MKKLVLSRPRMPSTPKPEENFSLLWDEVLAPPRMLASRPALMVTLLPALRLEPTMAASRAAVRLMSCPAARLEAWLVLLALCSFLPSVP